MVSVDVKHHVYLLEHVLGIVGLSHEQSTMCGRSRPYGCANFPAANFSSGFDADSVLTYTLISLSVEIGRYDHQWTARHFEIIAVVCSRIPTIDFAFYNNSTNNENACAPNFTFEAVKRVQKRDNAARYAAEIDSNIQHIQQPQTERLHYNCNRVHCVCPGP